MGIPLLAQALELGWR